jgi:hypothetical protein
MIALAGTDEIVARGLDPRVHVFLPSATKKTWMAGSSAAKEKGEAIRREPITL